MSKIAFVFAGQGAQKVGMGREIAEKYPEAMQTWDAANAALGFDVKQMVWEGDSETLMLTENTQPAILTMSVACLKALESHGIKADVVAGLSLGEYTAHVASGSIAFEDAVKLVKKRGRFMQEAVPKGVGTMAAIIGLADNLVIEACNEASDAGYVAPANFNCPGQLVIAGEVAAVEKACELCKAKGAKRAMVLPVSAPFHCKMLAPAAENLQKELADVSVGTMNIPVVTNVTADYVSGDIKTVLTLQVTSPVKWEASVRKMLADGVDAFVEIGPGKALGGFVGKITSEAKVFNVEDLASLDITLMGLAAKG